jgi:uncharacterized OB-fold protein
MADIPPLPIPNLDNQAFWDGCREHEFRIQRCANCGTFRHYPRPTCYKCRSFDTELVTVPGEGTVYSYTITHRTNHAFFRDKVPFVIAVVELNAAPGVRMASNIIDCEPGDVSCGMPVSVVWDEVAPDVSLYRFKPSR